MGDGYRYLKIYEELRAAIISGNLADGEKMPTEKELIARYGVSRITAIKAMQKLENEHLISRVRGSGSFVTYRDVSTFSTGAIPLNVRSKNIAFVANCSMDVIGYILVNFQKAAISKGYNVSIFDTSSEEIRQSNILRTVSANDFCGIVCQPQTVYGSIREYLDIMANKLPMVFIDSNLPLFRIPYVKSNNYLGGYKLTKELIKYGHKNIGVVFSDFADTNEQERFGGYLRALAENQLPFYPDNLILYDYKKRSLDRQLLIGEQTYTLFSVSSAVEDLRKFMGGANAPTAFFCMYDELASYIEQYAMEAGYKIPEHFSVAGYNNSTICDRMITPLMSVDQNYHAIADKMLKLITDMLEGKSIQLENLIEPMVCVRESVGQVGEQVDE